ncbi:morphogenetic protein [Yersinia mollaretii]|uniref:Morphogenetic protein n=1 Tax=Yersinia mollaretii TaxID=33060 RepID=A0AA44I0B6_YERMO|nr:morphogenetic protein [Yersinia mollaretii]NIL23503.1 morphogenetic protein [Yersinia mollaretii]
MRERPILFNAEMVNAILSGRKTQTRRIISEKTLHLFGVAASAGECHPIELCDQRSQSYYLEFCPLGKPDDQLWVRETFGQYRVAPSGFVYRADGELSCGDPERWTPSIHMPRWASRINLLITGVRVERLRDISEQDAAAEGLECYIDDGVPYYGPFNNGDCRPDVVFRGLWDSIYGKKEGENWEANPWVWVIEFEQVKGES